MVDIKSTISPVHTLPPRANTTVASKGAQPKQTAGAKTAPTAAKPAVKQPQRPADFSSLPFWMGLTLSIVWVAVVAVALLQSGATHTFAGLPLVNWALGLSAITAPVGLIWMVSAYLQRAADVQTVVEPLRRQLMLITGESGLAEQRIRRFNQAIREQLELLRDTKNANHDDLKAIMDRVRDYQSDLEQFEQNSLHQVKEVQEVIRRSLQHIEQVMEDKFTMLRILDGKLSQSGTQVAEQTDVLREQLGALLQEIEANGNLISISLERAMHDSKKLADTARAQESSITGAADTAASTLGELSGKIDLNIARFLERASSARSEAERLANALDAQTRSLDEFSTTMPVRVGEAEAVLRGVADRLYASEQLARDQAVSLSEKLSVQVDNLQGMLDHFAGRVTEIDGALDQRHNTLDAVVGRISGALDGLAQQLDDTVDSLGARADNSLGRFRAVNEEARRGADDVAVHLSETAARYESAAVRLQDVSGASNAQMKLLTDEIGHQLGQFEALQNATRQAGEEVQTRAVGAMQNLQYVLERLLAARDGAQSVGDTLTERLRKAVDENETMIIRLNEAAQMSVRAIGIASEAIQGQEDAVAGKGREVETTLREAMAQLAAQAALSEQKLRDQNAAFVALLNESTEKLSATELQMQDFAVRAVQPVQKAMEEIDQHTTAGLGTLGRYGETMHTQLDSLQKFNTEVTSMGDAVAENMSTTLDAIEKLNARFLALRSEQDDTTRRTVQQFTIVAEHLQSQVGTFNDQTATAVEFLQSAASQVGAESGNLLRESEEATAKMQKLTATLQSETTQTREVLQKQADELTGDLSRAEQNLSALTESLKQRTDTAYDLIDRVATHYNEMTKQTSSEFESRAAQLETVTGQASGKVEALNLALMQQMNLIGNSASQMDTQAKQIVTTSDQAVDKLRTLNDTMTTTQQNAATSAQTTLTRLEEVNGTLKQQSGMLNEAAYAASSLIQKAGEDFSFQVGKLSEVTNQTEQQFRGLNVVAASLIDQATAARTAVDAQGQRLVTSLAEAVAQMDSTSGKLQQVVASAMLGADQANERFSLLTQNASSRLGTANQEIITMAAKTETTLGSLGKTVAQQVSSLSMISDQIMLQHNSIASSGEMQRTQMVDLFEKIGSAHAQASDVADRSITRLGDALQLIDRQLGQISDQSQGTLATVRMAGDGFADQASMLLQHAQQAEQQARTVLSVTGALQEQAGQLRDTLYKEGERTSDLLGTLLGKISAGSVDLRDLGSAAESTLSSLQETVNHQTMSFADTMQKIVDRQRDLMTSLDTQRDSLNDLLARLTQAQLATAATGENVALRLTDSTKQISNQIASMDTQAQTALTSIRSVSANVSDEAGALQLQAQQAEQQLRNMLSVASGLHDQARQLRESVGDEASRVITAVSDVTAQLETTANQLKQQGTSTVANVDQASFQLGSIAKASCEAMQAHSNELSAMAKSVENSIQQSGEKIRGQLRLVGEAGEQADTQARRLAATADQATSKLAAMRDSFAMADSEGRDLLAKATGRVDEVRVKLYDELQHIADVSDTAVRLIQAAGGNLMTQSDTLRSNLSSSESALSDAAALMREESSLLPSLMSRGTTQIESAVQVLKNQAAESSDALVKTADRFIGVTGSIRDGMMEEMRELDTVTTTAERTLRAFTAALSDQLTSMKSGSGQLAMEQQTLIAAANQTLTQLVSATDRLSSLHQNAETTAEQLSRAFVNIEQRADAANQKLAQISGGLTQLIDQLAQTAGRAEGQLVGASQGFRDQLERVRSGVQDQIDDINRGLMQITSQLERTSGALKTVSAGAIVDIGRANELFDDVSKDAADLLNDRTVRMRSATEEVAKLLNGFGDQLDVLLDRLSMAGDGIKRNESDLLGRLQMILGQLGSVAERLEANRLLTADVSDQAVGRLTDVIHTVEKQMKNFAADTDTVSGLVRGISGSYADQAQTLNRSVTDAQNQVLAMEQTIDSLQQRTDRMRVSLKLQGDELVNSLSQILQQLSSAGDIMGDTVDELSTRRYKEGDQKIG